ncbi:hypothetical protein FN846DRAFT_680638 [Sphaerosporella brunnea]|uniref:Uncharacterized protein n=1 Tax=Sphaerosporella brunnea TaxID=1250544 RepID=A0A5J5EZD3_9PEZI|nr:hypothetical protein FN846DRAFT_680638 [Sphaerosporella brunnea]
MPPVSALSMRIPRRPSSSIPEQLRESKLQLLRRDNESGGSGETKALIIAVVFVAVVAVLFLGYLLLRHCRKRRQEPPGFLPERLKKRWRGWQPGTYTNPGPTARLPSTRSRNRRTQREQRQQQHQQVGVDRHTSVRSVMTLPEYRPIAAADRERTIGREGERGGIDVVIEFPETADEEEERREEHMQTLYEIRLARQLERAAQRESGEVFAASANGRPGSSTSSIRLVTPDPPSSAAQLMAALASITERERRLSKVQYAEIGVARHDGTRVRPSMDSDRPLLEGPGAMSTGGASIRSAYHAHGRTDSGTSYVTGIGTPERRGSEEIIRMGSARPSMETRPSMDNRAEGGPSLNVGRESQDGILPPPPPFPEIAEPPVAYDGADWGPPPDYTSPVETSNHHIEGLPVLRIDTGTPTPGVSRAPSPTRQPTVRRVSDDNATS